MFEIRAATQDELEPALRLMKLNMTPCLLANGITWNEDWHRANYADKDNYSIVSGKRWIGFLSLELEQECLFIHTLQLIPDVQGNIYGFRIFEWLKARAMAANSSGIGCRAFSNSPVVQMYSRLGFMETGKQGPLVDLQWELKG